MIALLRYVAADLIASRRWLAPALVYLAVLSVSLGPPPADAHVVSVAGAIFAGGAVAVFPIAAWLTALVCDSEDDLQEAVTVCTAGSRHRVRLAKGIVGAAAAAALGGLGMLAIEGRAVATGAPDVAFLGLGTVAVGLNALGGAAVGFVAARAVMPWRAVSLLTIVLATLAEIVVPGLPPGRAVLEALNADHDVARSLAVGGVGTVVLAAALVVPALWVTDRRT